MLNIVRGRGDMVSAVLSSARCTQSTCIRSVVCVALGKHMSRVMMSTFVDNDMLRSFIAQTSFT